MFKKVSLTFLSLIFALGLTGISKAGQRSADAYPAHNLTVQNEVRTVSVDYKAHDSDLASNKAMDRKVNGYLHSIKNIQKYHIKVMPNNVNHNGSEQSENV